MGILAKALTLHPPPQPSLQGKPMSNLHAQEQREFAPGFAGGTPILGAPECTACSLFTLTTCACRQGSHSWAGPSSLKELIVVGSGGRDTGSIEVNACLVLPAASRGWPDPCPAASSPDLPHEILICNAACSRELQEDEAPSRSFWSSSMRAASALILLPPSLQAPPY